jgi:hypothetical protein
LYSRFKVAKSSATEMGREKEVLEPWSTPQLRGKPGTCAHLMKRTPVGSTPWVSAAVPVKQKSKADHSSVGNIQKLGRGVATPTTEDVGSPSVEVHA